MADSYHPFDDLLDWLDLEREVAAQKYEVIRAGLIRIFVSVGFSDAEDLADLTIDRVVKKLPEIMATYEGAKVRYFHGVARNIIHERRRRREVPMDHIPELLSQPATTSDKYDCLLKCLKFVTPEKRDLILDYYLYKGHEKATHHHRMAEEQGITQGALRTRAHHIRAALEKCVLNCCKTLLGKQKTS